MSALAQWTSVDTTDMSVHIQQTNDRLQCIQQHLMSPASFQGAARELLEWCSDTRAFQWQFEQCLIGCLTVVSQISAQPGYDLDLGYRLLAVCATHRDKFSSKSAGLLSVWCEELSRLLLIRHQRNNHSPPNNTSSSSNCTTTAKRTPTDNSGMQASSLMQQHMQPNADMLPWPHGGPQPSQDGLSVATSAWGASQQTTPQGMYNSGHSSRLPSYANTTMTSGGPYSQQTTFSNLHKMGYNSSQQNMPPYVNIRQQTVPNYQRHNGYPPSATGMASVNPTASTPGHDTLSGANIATVTGSGGNGNPSGATAVAVMGMDESRQQNPQMTMNSQYAAAQMSAGVPMATGPGQQFGPQYTTHYGNHFGPTVSQKVSTPSSGMLSPMSMGPGPAMAMGPGPTMTGPNMGPAAGPPSNPPGGMQLAGDVGPMMGGPGAMMAGQGPIMTGPGPGQVKRGHMMMKGSMYSGMHQRTGPYPNPQQYMQTKRAQFPNGQQEPGFGAQPPYGASMMQSYGWGSGRLGCPHIPGQQSANYGASQQQQQQQQVPTQQTRSNGSYCGIGPGATQMQYMQSKVPPGQQCQPTNGANFSPQYSQMTGYPNLQSPVLGNPTPPMTPSYLSPTEMKPVLINGKLQPSPAAPMMVKKDTDDLRLTFPVRDGVVLPPFRLEHNLAVSNHIFHLRESVYQTLMWRPDLELQLKCFHHEDHQMYTNWPVSVTISVNARMLMIERGENKTCHRPLYLKDVCQPGRNTIQITVSACCCSHLFILQLVHRPSVKSVLQGLLRKRLLPAEHCITKIKRSFSVQPGLQTNPVVGEDGVEQTAIKLPLKCPITYRCISLPARGHDCKHIQCFDLESYLQLNCERGIWRCPICNKSALLEGLEIDQYIWGILHSLSETDFEEVTIDTTASWKPVVIKTIKEEDAEACSKRWMSAISPSSMTLPTMSSWQDRYQDQLGPAGQTPMISQVGPMYGTNSSTGAGFSEASHGPNPAFPTSNTPDFLSSLSQMGDNLLPSDRLMGNGNHPRTPMDGQTGNPRTPNDGGQMCHARTPLDNQIGHVHTPMDGAQLSHPRTPVDGQLCPSRASLDGGQSGMTSEGQNGGHLLRHCAPGTPGSLGNPLTPASCSSGRTCRNGSAEYGAGSVCSSGNGNNNNAINSGSDSNNGGAANSGSNVQCSSSNSLYSNALANNSFAGQQQSQQQQQQSLSAGNSIDSGFSTDLGFHTSALIDGDSMPGQESLDLLPDNIGDPTELLSYLGPGENENNSNNDDLLSLFS